MGIKNKAMLVINALHYPFKKWALAKEVTGKTVVLDFNHMKDCKLRDCDIVYFGLGSCSLIGCDIQQCRFVFEGPAKNTHEFMSVIFKADPSVCAGSFPFMPAMAAQMLLDLLGKDSRDDS